MKKTDNSEIEPISELKMRNINLLFAAYGSFLSGLFSILQYFFYESKLFNLISLCCAMFLLLVVYFLSYSKWATKFYGFWNYIRVSADIIGILNPFMLALSIILSVARDRGILITCILFELAHLVIYIIAIEKSNIKMKKLCNKILHACKANMAILITALFAAVSLVLWLVSTSERSFTDLWLNLLAGFISSLITIAVIERIIKRQKVKNELPLRKTMYRDIQLFTSRFIYLWRDMYEQSCNERCDLSVDELFTEEKIEVIRSNLNLKTFPNVTPKQNWFTYLLSCRTDLVTRGEKIISTYANAADPKVIQALHYIINDGQLLGNLSFMEQIYAYDIQNKVPRPPLLMAYTPPTNASDFDMIHQLISWCHAEYERLKNSSQDDIVDIYTIPKTLTFTSKPPLSIMSDEEKEAAITAFEEWQKRA